MNGGGVDLLHSMDIFEPLSENEVGRISGGVPVQLFERGRKVYTPAYRGGVFFLLLDGRVRVYRMEKESEGTLSVVRAGEVFGEAAFTERRRKGSYAEAMETSRVGLMSRETLSQIIHDCPGVGMKCVELLSERLSECEERTVSISLKKVPSRVASLLLNLARTEGVPTPEGRKIPTRYTHEQLGAMIGSGRVAVSRAFSNLKKSGAIEFKKRHIHIIDMDALKEASTAS